MLFVPLMAVSMARIAKDRMGNATSIFNLMRNIGGSIGIAVMTTFLARREQVHQDHLVSNISTGSEATRQALQGMEFWFRSHGASGYDAGQKALGALYGMVQRQAAMLAFVEAFWLMAVVFVLMLPLLLLLRHPRSKVKSEKPTELPPSTSDVLEEEELLLVH
jgi:DHA2 family multidrug resistance protein